MAKVIDWPTIASDWNPFEHVWSVIKRQVEKNVNYSTSQILKNTYRGNCLCKSIGVDVIRMTSNGRK